MNAAGQRRLTSWLLSLCLLLGAAWAVLMVGVGRGVYWKTPLLAHPLPPVRHATAKPVPPLAHYADIWRRPLFTATRRPVVAVAAGKVQNVSLDNWELTGVILAPGLRVALLSDRHDGHAARAREGAHLAHSRWVLETLEPRSAVFVDGAQRTRLSLDVPEGRSNPVAATSPPTPSRPQSAQLPQAVHQGTTDTAARRARIQAIKQRIEQLRRQHAAHAGAH